MTLRRALSLLPIIVLIVLLRFELAQSADVAAIAPPPSNTAPPTAAIAEHTVPHEITFQKDVLPFLKQHCFACHGNGKKKADLSFDRFTDDQSVLKDRRLWDNVQGMLASREM